ncbi:hypothetical protein R3P38DRAFT_2771923 [Favolaschia claudopus]|uniref:Uncharacterized protein n=1 Tax=Favolaschia claudopus TaxID=2862362 RepID=A0AAW0C9A6_9AGAR
MFDPLIRSQMGKILMILRKCQGKQSQPEKNPYEAKKWFKTQFSGLRSDPARRVFNMLQSTNRFFRSLLSKTSSFAASCSPCLDLVVGSGDFRVPLTQQASGSKFAPITTCDMKADGIMDAKTLRSFCLGLRSRYATLANGSKSVYYDIGSPRHGLPGQHFSFPSLWTTLARFSVSLNPKWNGCLISCWGCASAGSEPGHSPLTASVGRLVLSGPTVLIRYLMLVKDALPPSWPWTRKAPCPRGRGAILNAVPQDRSAREPGIYVLYLDSESRAHNFLECYGLFACFAQGVTVRGIPDMDALRYVKGWFGVLSCTFLNAA